ncbi:hypothetical protein MAR_004056 [Mya arenaria]|uniref:Uncharacterized protein n=1 Tax=Mya arenaria TaxID=6604 RepID=A0ABY7EYN5_MYAAR|nr:hypothetical protein MAR_004056 [Mya arenaria]
MNKTEYLKSGTTQTCDMLMLMSLSELREDNCGRTMWSVVLSGIAVDSTPFRFKHAISHPPITTDGENPAGEELGDKGDSYDPNKEWFQYSKGLCPLGQVPQRNETVCCLPTACPPKEFKMAATEPKDDPKTLIMTVLIVGGLLGHLPSVLVSVNGTLPNGNANVNSQVIRDGNGNVNSYIVNSEGQVLLKGGDDKDFVSESDGNRPRNLEIGNGHIPTGRGTANGICRLYNGTGVSKDGNIVSDLQELGVTPRNATDDSAGEFAEVLTDETRANIANVQHLRAPGDGVKPTKDSNKENSINSVNSEMQHYMDHLNATEASGEKVNDMSKEQLNTSILRQAMEKGDLDVSLIHSPDNDKDHSDAERTYICMDSEAGRKAVIGKYGDLDTQSGVKGGSKLKDSVSVSGNKSHVKAVSVSGNKSDVKAEAVGLREFASSGMIKQESADDRNVTFKDAKPDIGKRETRQKTNGGIVFNKCKINCTTLIINNGTGNGQPDVEFDDSEESDGSSASDPDSSDAPIQAPVQGHPLRPENSFSEGQPSSMIYGVAHFSEQSDIADGRQLDSLVHSNRLPRNHSNRVESGIHSPDNHQAVSGGNSSVRSSGGTNTPSHLRMDELKSYPLEGESNSGDMNGDSLLPESSLEVNYNVVTDSGLGDDVAGRNNEQSNSLDRNVPNVLERQEPEGFC